jgi:sulfatase maturation enzyme AslB (radical SAM superfamily)
MFDKKILYLGNNSQETDTEVSLLAQRQGTKNHGLVDKEDFDPVEFGLYHTSLMDLPSGAVIKIAEKFSGVVMLDQPKELWSHWKLLISTHRLMRELDQLGIIAEYKNNKNIQTDDFFNEFLQNNKSLCIYPWIQKIAMGDSMVLCARSYTKVTAINELKSWKNDPSYTNIRNTMLNGDQLPNHCKVCYDYESKGIESYRQFETKEWISKLNITSLNDLDAISHPYFYEVRLNNKCNLACRGCQPSFSSRIEEEFQKFNIQDPKPRRDIYSSLDIIDKDTLSPDVRVYLTGGEPTVMVPVYQFMQECIDLGKTDFDFTIGTNGAVISNKFLNLADHFENMNFSVSLDGYGKVNDYWRWGSDWDQVIANTKELQRRGHTISINCVPGIYNVTNLHLLLEFLDRELPFAGIYLQINYNSAQSAFTHPNSKLVVESMEKCKKTKFYYTDGKSMKTTIDSLYNYYSSDPAPNIDSLKEFFAFNDRLDQIRNVRLVDYIPELEECRKYIL